MEYCFSNDIILFKRTEILFITEMLKTGHNIPISPALKQI